MGSRSIWRLRRTKVDPVWILVVIVTTTAIISLISLFLKRYAHTEQVRKIREALERERELELIQRNLSDLSYKRDPTFYQFASPRGDMCFFSRYIEGEGMPKLHSGFADPVSHNVLFVGTRYLTDNWTRETFVAHFEKKETVLCDPVVEDYLSFGRLSQFNVVITCPMPKWLYKMSNFTLTLQRTSNVERYRRYAYDDITVCLSGASKFRRYQLTACTMLRNMDHYIPEWILFHRFVGVQHFFLYDNEPEESSTLRQTVQKEIAEGLVTVIPWTHTALGEKTYLEVQIAHENDCVWRNRYRTKWMIKVDVDEFVQPMNVSQRRITDYLTDPHFERLASVRLQNWFFGRNVNRTSKSKSGSIIETNTWRPGYPSLLNGGHDKNIVQPKYVHYFKIHAVKIGAEVVTMDPRKELRLVHYRQDNKRVRYFDLPPFSTKDLSMVHMFQEAKQTFNVS